MFFFQKPLVNCRVEGDRANIYIYIYMHIPIVNWKPRVSVGMEPYSRANFNFRYTTGSLKNCTRCDIFE